MTFVQTISFSSSRFDEMQKVMTEWEAAQPPNSTPGFVGTKVLRDRDNPNAFMVVAEFDSYEAAMENSNKPETGAFAARMGELTDGQPSYGNYDVMSAEA
jgi:quinol monooxygenase YgiN